MKNISLFKNRPITLPDEKYFLVVLIFAKSTSASDKVYLITCVVPLITPCYQIWKTCLMTHASHKPRSSKVAKYSPLSIFMSYRLNTGKGLRKNIGMNINSN